MPDTQNKQMDIKKWETLLLPSRWSIRDPIPEAVINLHTEFVRKESERVRETIPFEVVQYGDKFALETFDIYGTDLPNDAPIFVFIHGGYWQMEMLDKTVSAFPVEPLYNAGHKVIVLDYDFCPKITLEQLFDQVQRAGIFIVNYAKSLGTSCLQFGGHCCGAQLCMALFDKLVQESPSLTSMIKSMYLFCGTYDTVELRMSPDINPNNILALDEDGAFRLTSYLYDFPKWIATIEQNGTPTVLHLYTAEYDAPKLVGQTYCMERVLGLYGYPNYDLQMVEKSDHFEIVENLSKPDFLITKQIITEAKSFASKN